MGKSRFGDIATATIVETIVYEYRIVFVTYGNDGDGAGIWRQCRKRRHLEPGPPHHSAFFPAMRARLTMSLLALTDCGWLRAAATARHAFGIWRQAFAAHLFGPCRSCNECGFQPRLAAAGNGQC